MGRTEPHTALEPRSLLPVGWAGFPLRPPKGRFSPVQPTWLWPAGLPGSQSISPTPVSVVRAFPARLRLPLHCGCLCWAGHLLQGALLSIITAKTQLQVRGQDLIYLSRGGAQHSTLSWPQGLAFSTCFTDLSSLGLGDTRGQQAVSRGSTRPSTGLRSCCVLAHSVCFHGFLCV